VKLDVRSTNGEVVDRVEVRDEVFGAPANPFLVHQVMVGQQANARQGTASTKTRAQVSGGGRKPFSQKGTGRARQGSTRSPVLRGGGVVFGPHPRSFRHRTPKRMKRQSLLVVLSDKVREGDLVVVDNLTLERPATSEMVRVLDALDAGPPVLMVADGADHTVLRSARNIPRLKLVPASLLNTLDLLKHRKVVMTMDAVRKAEEVWGGPFVRIKRRRAEPAPQTQS
jgi:large subunit ribosomal protein L4